MKVYVWLILFVPLTMRLLPLDLLLVELDQGSGQSAQRHRLDNIHIDHVPPNTMFADVISYNVDILL